VKGASTLASFIEAPSWGTWTFEQGSHFKLRNLEQLAHPSLPLSEVTPSHGQGSIQVNIVAGPARGGSSSKSPVIELPVLHFSR
jgi:hypothetical protein